MTANKRKIAGSVAVIVFAGAAAFAIGRYGGFAPGLSGSGASSSATTDATDPTGRSRDRASPEDKLTWRALTPAQREALQPLEGEWNRMDGVRKAKWLELARRLAAMKPEERQRVHERMRAWVKLTPEQRELARETYMRARKIAPEKKSATWQNYQNLPEDQKRKLAESAGRKKPDAAREARPAPNKAAVSCPAGMVRNTASGNPPCVNAPPPPFPTRLPTPTLPPPPPLEQEKQVPANWGITPNNA